ncbi:tetratricopeptide repeat protein [Altererythrobacter sp. SALINAS58]|uniref:tetratricopeptide repeat protein n=1 Tax=Alteripontixanthobacter muriae TaxID=2705546 RepID=UPI0019D64558|nr:tetratricopeptide repeat protein [Alteripontixanthobacter muriae]NTZ42179.1 tetratricopeptide repeat protein [Alteripontixanthobacter muriae]
MKSPTSEIAGRIAVALMAGGAIVLPAAPAAAQTVSRPVVQSLPSPAVADLQTALRRLARDTRDLDALIDAGTASLQLGDIDAAIGFFGRAEDLSPGNPRIKVGLAGAFLRSDRPLEALRLFSEAEAAGASTAALAGDRGLAYDLVGDNVSAQAQYRSAISSGGDAEMQRRLALSQAIAGNREGFEQTLLPLLNNRDFGAYRVRAFGLAILGDEEEAVAIAEAVMPGHLSDKIVPYLRYMPRLTRAQQAAAGNLGIFPRAAQIGRDDPRIAQYSANAALSALTPTQNTVQSIGSGSRLAPSGPPLGGSSARTAPATEPNPGQATTRRVSRSANASAGSQAPRDDAEARRRARIAARQARSNRRSASDPLSRASGTGRTSPPVQKPVQTASPAPAQVPAAQLAGVRIEVPEPAVQNTSSGVATATGELPALVTNQAGTPTPLQDTALVQSQAARPVIALAEPAAENVPSPSDTTAAAMPVIVASAGPAATASGRATSAPDLPEPASVEDAFAAFALTPVAAPVGGIDITAIDPPREIRRAEPRPAAPVAETPPPPAHPSRIWVQVATGRDRDALAFDWRRISRKAGDLLADQKGHLAEWNDANRLLAGPLASRSAAQELVTALKAEDVDSFVFTSRAGEVVEPLG